MEHPFTHHRIAMDAFVGFEALFLSFAGGNHALANLLTGFAWLHLTELRERYGLYLAVDVNAVE